MSRLRFLWLSLRWANRVARLGVRDPHWGEYVQEISEWTEEVRASGVPKAEVRQRLSAQFRLDLDRLP